jgi:hypothetical protein
MIESIKPTTKTTEQDKERKTGEQIEHPSDAIFKAYIEGNARMPQTFQGIRIFVAAAALEDQNLDWTEFLMSRFSKEQADHILKIMERMHDKKSIDVSIHTDRIHSLWKQAKGGCENLLNDCLDNLDTDFNAIFRDRTYFINYISDPKNEEISIKLKEVVTAVRNALRSEPVSALLRSWRNEFDHSKLENRHKGSSTWGVAGYNKRLLGILDIYMAEHHPEIPKKLFRDMF